MLRRSSQTPAHDRNSNRNESSPLAPLTILLSLSLAYTHSRARTLVPRSFESATRFQAANASPFVPKPVILPELRRSRGVTATRGDWSRVPGENCASERIAHKGGGARHSSCEKKRAVGVFFFFFRFSSPLPSSSPSPRGEETVSCAVRPRAMITGTAGMRQDSSGILGHAECAVTGFVEARRVTSRWRPAVDAFSGADVSGHRSG